MTEQDPQQSPAAPRLHGGRDTGLPDDLLDDAAAAEPPAVAIATDEDTGNKASP